MEHIFDDHHVLQSYVVKRGYKKSALPCSKKYHLSFDETIAFFFVNLNDTEIDTIREFQFFSDKMEWIREKIEEWCRDILLNTLRHTHSCYRYGPEKINLRDIVMERVALKGCADTIFLLKRHYYKQQKVIRNSNNYLFQAA